MKMKPSLKIKLSDVIMYMLWFVAMAASFRTQITYLCLYGTVIICIAYCIYCRGIELYPEKFFLLSLPIFILVSYYTRCDYKTSEWIRTVAFLTIACVVFIAPYKRFDFTGIIGFIKHIAIWFYGMGIYIQLLFPSVYAIIMKLLFASRYSGTQYGSDWVGNNAARLELGYCTGFTTDSAATAYFMLIGLACILFPAISEKRRLTQKEVLQTVFLIIAVTLTGKRSALLFGFVAFLVVHLVSSNNRALVTKIVKILVVAIFAILLCIYIYQRFGTTNAIGRLVDSFYGYREGRDITAFRSVLNVYTWSYIRENPIYGIGWGNLITRNYLEHDLAINAHNVYLQFWAECGLIGLVLLVAYFAINIIRNIIVLRRCMRQGSTYLVLTQISLLIQCYFVFYAYTGNPLYSASYTAPYYLALLISGYCNMKTSGVRK